MRQGGSGLFSMTGAAAVGWNTADGLGTGTNQNSDENPKAPVSQVFWVGFGEIQLP